MIAGGIEALGEEGEDGALATAALGDEAGDGVWKTEKSWSGTRRQLVIKLNDGTIHRANFRFD